MTTTKELAENATLTMVARFAMIIATAMLPIAAGGMGWLLVRAVGSLDEVSHKADTIRDQVLETSSNVKLIQQQQTVQGAILADHEARVRLLERQQQRVP